MRRERLEDLLGKDVLGLNAHAGFQRFVSHAT